MSTAAKAKAAGTAKPRKQPELTAPKLTIERVRQALKINHGIQAYAARALGVTRQCINQWVKKHPELEAVISEANVEIVDAAQGVVVSLLSHTDPNIRSRNARYILDNWGAERGFGVRRHEHSGPKGGAIPVTWDLSALSDQELDQLEQLSRKIAPAGSADVGDPGGEGTAGS